MKKGLAVSITSKEDYDVVQKYLGTKTLYINFSESMLSRPTSVVIKAKKEISFSSGSVGASEYQESEGVKIISIDEFIKKYYL